MVPCYDGLVFTGDKDDMRLYVAVGVTLLSAIMWWIAFFARCRRTANYGRSSSPSA
jgi:hypothetical protein